MPSQLCLDITNDPHVRRGRRCQDRHIGWKPFKEIRYLLVVGAEIVSPIGHAVRLVNDEQTDVVLDPIKHIDAKLFVGEPLRGDNQKVARARDHTRLDLRPLLPVCGVDRVANDPHALGRRDLVAHKRQKRRHQQRYAASFLTEKLGGKKVDHALAPPRPLDDQLTPMVQDAVYRLPLPITKIGIIASDSPTQHLHSLFPRHHVRLPSLYEFMASDRSPNGLLARPQHV